MRRCRIGLVRWRSRTECLRRNNAEGRGLQQGLGFPTQPPNISAYIRVTPRLIYEEVGKKPARAAHDHLGGFSP